MISPNASPLTPHGLLDDDLSALSREDLARVVRFIEDRFVNAVSPLAVRLEMSQDAVRLGSHFPAMEIIGAARRAVEKVMAGVEEMRALAHRPRTIDHGPSSVVHGQSSGPGVS